MEDTVEIPFFIGYDGVVSISFGLVRVRVEPFLVVEPVLVVLSVVSVV